MLIFYLLLFKCTKSLKCKYHPNMTLNMCPYCLPVRKASEDLSLITNSESSRSIISFLLKSLDMYSIQFFPYEYLNHPIFSKFGIQLCCSENSSFSSLEYKMFLFEQYLGYLLENVL